LQIILAQKKDYVESETLCYAIEFITFATTLDATMEKLTPFVDTLLYETIMPIMFVTAKDIEIFEVDPVEYVRGFYDFSEMVFLPRNQV